MSHRRRLLRLRAVVAALAVLVGGLLNATPASAAAATTDVVFVHGFNGCTDAMASGMWPLLSQYYWRHAPAATLHAVKYYGCDTDGDSIVEYGPSPDDYYPSPDDDFQKTDIRHFSYELAWWLWDTFTSRGKPVDLIGHSMGGVLVTFALQRVAAGDPAFPPYLNVPTVVTFSAPFSGVRGLTCPATNTECNELLPGSPFVTQVMAGGAAQAGAAADLPATTWLTIGSTGCDIIGPASTIALPRATWAVNYTYPCYTHTGYVSDMSTAMNAMGTINGQPFAGSYHAIAMMNLALD